jgi:hypothetical protein
VKIRRLQQKNAEWNQGHRGFQRIGSTLISGGDSWEFTVLQNYFFKHQNETQTATGMFGWATGFREDMIKKVN